MIICECGHPIIVHDKDHCCLCCCENGFHTVEARYWARRMKEERDLAQMSWRTINLDYRLLITEYIALQGKLDTAIESLEYYSHSHDKFMADVALSQIRGDK